MGCAGGELFYSRLDKLGLKLDVRVSLAEFIMTKINKFSFGGPFEMRSNTLTYSYLPTYRNVCIYMTFNLIESHELPSVPT